MGRDTLKLPSGAERDTSEGKPRYDLICAVSQRRLADHLGRGASKYSERNWEKGMPTSRSLESALRHLHEYHKERTVGISPYEEEDHLAAVLFNVMALIRFERTEHDDIETLSVPADNESFG